MQRKHHTSHELMEHCGCSAEPTAHRVTVSVLSKSDAGDAAGFSREPYRIAECERCGDVTRQRMSTL